MSKVKLVWSIPWLLSVFVSCSSDDGGQGTVEGPVGAPSTADTAGTAATLAAPSPMLQAPAAPVAGAVDLGAVGAPPMEVAAPPEQTPSPIMPTPDMPADGVGAPVEEPEPAAPDLADLEPFSFFVTSLGAMQMLSGNPEGFGGDLRYGEATGLAGADKICAEIAEISMEGASQKQWRAFLSATSGGDGGGPVHAKDRIGDGPWYDRLGRLVAQNLADLINQRPVGADPSIINDLPNEYGIPNHLDGADVTSCGTGLDTPCPDNHDVMTGSNPEGMLYNPDASFTCDDWTSSEGDTTITGPSFPVPGGGGFPAPGGGGFPAPGGGGFPGFLAGEGPWCGHSWPRRGSGEHWISALREGGCAPCARVIEMGGPNARCVGAGGGYGGIYCFALNP